MSELQQHRYYILVISEGLGSRSCGSVCVSAGTKRRALTLIGIALWFGFQALGYFGTSP